MSAKHTQKTEPTIRKKPQTTMKPLSEDTLKAVCGGVSRWGGFQGQVPIRN